MLPDLDAHSEGRACGRVLGALRAVLVTHEILGLFDARGTGIFGAAAREEREERGDASARDVSDPCVNCVISCALDAKQVAY